MDPIDPNIKPKTKIEKMTTSPKRAAEEIVSDPVPSPKKVKVEMATSYGSPDDLSDDQKMELKKFASNAIHDEIMIQTSEPGEDITEWYKGGYFLNLFSSPFSASWIKNIECRDDKYYSVEHKTMDEDQVIAKLYDYQGMLCKTVVRRIIHAFTRKNNPTINYSVDIHSDEILQWRFALALMGFINEDLAYNPELDSDNE